VGEPARRSRLTRRSLLNDEATALMEPRWPAVPYQMYQAYGERYVSNRSPTASADSRAEPREGPSHAERRECCEVDDKEPANREEPRD
jgi:hypothetical protein